MKSNRRISLLAKNKEESDPLSVIANLFDVAMVFAVALMVAMVMNMNMTEMFTNEDFTIVKNPGKDNIEIITREGKKIHKYVPSNTDNDSQKRGKRIGTAYQLENGDIIYLPE